MEASWHWIDGSEFSLKVIAVMRPCDGTSGLVRENRRKAVFAFKGLFSKGYLSRFRFGAVGFIAVFGSTGKSETSERNPIFTNKNRRAQMQDCGLVEGSRFFTALPEAFVSGMRQALEPLSATAFSRKRTAGRRVVSFRCDWPAIPADIVLVLLSCYSGFTAEVKLW